MDGRVILGVAVIGGGLGFVFLEQRRRAAAAVAAAPPPAAPEVVVAPPALPPAEAAAEQDQGLKLPKVPGGVLSTAGTIVAGIKVQNAIGDLAERVGGEGAGNVARVAPAIVGAGVVLGKAVEQGLERIGVANEPARIGGLVTGVALVAGGPAAVAVATTQLAGRGAQELLRVVAGDKVERAVSNAVSELDPLKPGSAANALIKPVAGVVESLGGLLGGKDKDEVRRQAEQQQRVNAINAAVEAGTVTQQQVTQSAQNVIKSLTGGGNPIANLVAAVRAGSVATAVSSPPPPPPPVVSVPSSPPFSPAATVAKAATLVKFGAKVPIGKAAYQP